MTAPIEAQGRMREVRAGGVLGSGDRPDSRAGRDTAAKHVGEGGFSPGPPFAEAPDGPTTGPCARGTGRGGRAPTRSPPPSWGAARTSCPWGARAPAGPAWPARWSTSRAQRRSRPGSSPRRPRWRGCGARGPAAGSAGTLAGGPREDGRGRRARLPPLDAGGAGPLFQAISDGCERRSPVIGANPELGRRATVFGDGRMAAAAVDRACRRGRLLRFRRESHRVRRALMRGGSETLTERINSV